jgi:hypothetical protein
MGVTSQLSDVQRSIIEGVAATQPMHWRSKFFDAVAEALVGSGPITDEDVRRAISRAINRADQADWSDDCCFG